MEFTTAQEKIIRQICKIQSDSAIRLIGNNMRIKDDESYQAKHLKRTIKEWGLTEGDLLETFSDICEDFDNLNDNPKLLPNLGQSSLRIFNKIFTEYCFTWKDLYPNAHNNLDRKLLSLLITVDKSDTNINLNLN
tara:strand:+ start:1824 stop:2228 length:405 start_codon:yes stop_codon:yes gene_type:complete